MWQRSELKDRAKNVLHTCYWNSVLVCFILMLLTGGVGRESGSGYKGNAEDVKSSWSDLFSMNSDISGTVVALIAAIIVGVVGIVLLISVLITLFAINPLVVGAKRFFMVSRQEKAGLGELGFAFKKGYFNVVKIEFLRGLFTWLWTLLFIIPWIIKGYEYRMIPYILAENPEIDYKEAFHLSKEMMTWEKWNTFVLDLSFILWGILSIFTCMIASVFYVAPYIQHTNAELYAILREKVLVSGVTSSYELKGFGYEKETFVNE